MNASRIVPANAQQICRAAKLLAAGELVAFPTETVYGLGANALLEAAVQQVFDAKGRPANNPLILHVSDASRAEELADLSDAAVRRRFMLLAPLWPGPLTLVLPKRASVGARVSAHLPTVALRVPAHPVAQQLLEETGFPIAAPSANLSGYVSPTTAQHVDEGLGNKVALILDGGPCAIGLESTIVALGGAAPRVLRHGALCAEDLEAALGEPLQLPAALARGAAPEAPGMLERHYSPLTPIRFRTEVGREQLPGRVGLITFAPPRSSYGDGAAIDYAKVSALSSDGGLEEVARNLFSTLREHDKLKLDLIVIDSCPEVGLGRAIMDRLKRAAARA